MLEAFLTETLQYGGLAHLSSPQHHQGFAVSFFLPNLKLFYNLPIKHNFLHFCVEVPKMWSFTHF